MRTIGLLGGMSPASTVPYYQRINAQVNARRGALHSAPMLIYSVDFEEISALQKAGRWDLAGARLADCGRSLAQAGAQALVLCTNTMHKVAAQIEAAVPVPLLHIVDVTARAAISGSVKRVALLGTRFTMEQAFWRERMAGFGVETMIPDADDRATVHRVIFDELCMGRVEAASREAFRAIIARLIARGARAVVLGCTEIGLLVRAEDSAVPLLDTTELHAAAAAAFVLGDA